MSKTKHTYGWLHSDNENWAPKLRAGQTIVSLFPGEAHTLVEWIQKYSSAIYCERQIIRGDILPNGEVHWNKLIALLPALQNPVSYTEALKLLKWN